MSNKWTLYSTALSHEGRGPSFAILFCAMWTLVTALLLSLFVSTSALAARACPLGEIAYGSSKFVESSEGKAIRWDLPHTDPASRHTVKNALLEPLSERVIEVLTRKHLIRASERGDYFQMLSELIANAIEYGNGRPASVTLVPGPKKAFTIAIADQSGKFFDPQSPKEPRNRRRMDYDPKDIFADHLPPSLRRTREGGLGVNMIYDYASNLGIGLRYVKNSDGKREGTRVVIERPAAK